MSLQGWIRLLLPREDHFYDFFEKQAAVAQRGARTLLTAGEAGVTIESIREKVQALEHEGDKLVHEVEEALARTFVTPIDREDIQRLSSELDTVLDMMNAAARMADLCGVTQPSEPMIKLMELVEKSTEILVGAMPQLRKHDYPALIEAGRAIKAIEKDGDKIYRRAVSALFQDPQVDAKDLLRQREVLEDIETALDHCERVADTLTNLAVKHG
jgi:uncharacterized protein Yka (UPF0111/DUF47 family)